MDVPTYAPTGIELPEPDFSLRAYYGDIIDRLGDPALALVDVRSPAEFSGEVIAPPGMTETAQRAGHIPGATSAPWAQTVNEDGTFKSADELREHYAAKGVTADKDIVAYCRIGERSSHSWFVLHELLGYERVRNYDGSWTEWGSHDRRAHREPLGRLSPGAHGPWLGSASSAPIDAPDRRPPHLRTTAVRQGTLHHD